MISFIGTNNIISMDDLIIEVLSSTREGGITLGCALKDIKATTRKFAISNLENKKEYLKYARHSKKREKLIKDIKWLEDYIVELNN